MFSFLFVGGTTNNNERGWGSFFNSTWLAGGQNVFFAVGRGPSFFLFSQFAAGWTSRKTEKLRCLAGWLVVLGCGSFFFLLAG